jgi:anthranilate phosphoribosyltransferase
VQKEALSIDLARAAMEQILAGEATPAQIGAFAVSMRMKGETPDEIAGMAEAMRRRVPPIRTRRHPLLDTCGTGGDNAGTFNISTTSRSSSPRAAGAPSTAIARCRVAPAAPMCSRRSGSAST